MPTFIIHEVVPSASGTSLLVVARRSNPEHVVESTASAETSSRAHKVFEPEVLMLYDDTSLINQLLHNGTDRHDIDDLISRDKFVQYHQLLVPGATRDLHLDGKGCITCVQMPASRRRATAI